MAKGSETVRERIRAHYATLTQAERKVVQMLLEDYPGAGLASITVVAERAGVSTPTVVRVVQKLGFKGFPQFHAALLKELQAKISNPTERRDKWAAEVPDSHLLNRFAQAVMNNMLQTFSNISTEQFDTAVRSLADTSSRLYVVGGRITRSLADYAFTHFQAIRPRVTYLTSSSATWSHYLLDMVEGDVVLIFDVRRYETNLERLAELAAGQGVTIILVTDQWVSPVAKVADISFNCWLEIPSAWDSNSATMVLLEALIAGTQEQRWPETRERFERLEALFDKTQLFRKFS